MATISPKHSTDWEHMKKDISHILAVWCSVDSSQITKCVSSELNMVLSELSSCTDMNVALKRFQMILNYSMALYRSSPDQECMIDIMYDAIDAIVLSLSPVTKEDWHLLYKDLKHILVIWERKESSKEASIVVEEITCMLKELYESKDSPTLMISEPQRSLSSTPIITHIGEYGESLEEEDEEEYDENEEVVADEEVDTVAAEVTCAEEEEEVVADEDVDTVAAEVTVAKEYDEGEEEEEEYDEGEEEEEYDEGKEEVVADEEEYDEGEEEEEEYDEGEEEEGEEEESEEEEEEEVVAAEVTVAKEEEIPEEAEAEVEQITIRGKTYWHDSASSKLYEVLEDDEVGQEIGILSNGKVRSLIRE